MSDPKPSELAQDANANSVQRLVREIVDRLFTTSYGTKNAQKGTRLVVMKGQHPNEIELGGWCMAAVEQEIESVLSNSVVHPDSTKDKLSEP